MWRAQLDFGAVVDALTALGYGDYNLDILGELFGFTDTVTVEQLAEAGVPNRTVFDVRRRLDPQAAAAEVCACTIREGDAFPLLEGDALTILEGDACTILEGDVCTILEGDACSGG